VLKVTEIKKKLKSLVDSLIFEHAVSVSETAYLLAKKYNISPTKAQIAGLLHDCAKSFTYDKQKQYIKEHNIKLDKIEEKSPKLWHCKLSAYLARHTFKVTQEDILRAIENHAKAGCNMDLLSKIIYIADYIDTNKRYPNAEEVKKLAFAGNLDEACLVVVNSKLKRLLEEGRTIHFDSIHFRNELLSKR
jgi:predicted HD superfamily hydrolase involved in NAD metabolism